MAIDRAGVCPHSATDLIKIARLQFQHHGALTPIAYATDAVVAGSSGAKSRAATHHVMDCLGTRAQSLAD